LVDFKNPATKKIEKRIYDKNLGLFVSFPRQNIFALYLDRKLIFESEIPNLDKVINLLKRVTNNVNNGRAWNA